LLSEYGHYCTDTNLTWKTDPKAQTINEL
jgi:hypothetical protein